MIVDLLSREKCGQNGLIVVKRCFCCQYTCNLLLLKDLLFLLGSSLNSLILRFSLKRIVK